MTIAQLEQLLQQHLPSAPPHPTEQGRAGVTKRPLRNGLTWRQADDPYSGNWDICPVCRNEYFVHRPYQKYCSNACKQKAYRQRKRGKRAA